MKLLILDGNSVLHRAYYALPDWRNRSGEATAGVYGFLSILLKTIEDLKPTHLAIVFDHPSPTFRNLMYVGYQANREKDRQISEDIWSMIEKLKQVFQLLSVPVFQLEGFEADDIIGTIGTQAQRLKGTEVIIITGDRDLMQLVNENVNLYMSFKGISDMTIVDSDKVKERLGILPSQVIDYKALVGDSSDNYPGVPGIGSVGAIKLIQEYGTFEKIYESLSITPQPPLNLRGGVNSKLIDGYESGELSKRLATIKCDVPFTFDIEKCSVPSTQKITEVLLDLGYKSLIKRIEVKSQDMLF
ncbi:hypothetical protein HZB69_04210 [Candidatus Amesbacteria bacterium]|nr:hypothetical protein [Candidatus Amesbacteria bacterium]